VEREIEFELKKPKEGENFRGKFLLVSEERGEGGMSNCWGLEKRLKVRIRLGRSKKRNGQRKHQETRPPCEGGGGEWGGGGGAVWFYSVVEEDDLQEGHSSRETGVAHRVERRRNYGISWQRSARKRRMKRRLFGGSLRRKIIAGLRKERISVRWF